MSNATATATALLARAGVTIGGDAPQDIQVHDDRLWDRVIRDRELGLGESYQDGWWDANQLDEFLAVVQAADLRSMIRPSPQIVAMMAKAAIQNQQTKLRAHKNAQAHYDIGNDLYERMLDKRMIYTCGYWRDAHDLDTAQEAKLDLICRKLDLEPGMNLLDIGCGWGGFAQFAAEHYGVHVTGISPAIEQVQLARERCADLPVQIEQLDYREVEGQFDRITSIGMMEHVGPRNLATFFSNCERLLGPDGLMLHHTIASNDWKKSGDPWFEKYIFPGGVLPSLGQIAKAAGSAWAIEDVHNFGPDYDRTLMQWHRNITDRWDEIPHYDERFRRTWDYYLNGAAAGFRVRIMQLYQVVFSRAKHPSEAYWSVR